MAYQCSQYFLHIYRRGVGYPSSDYWYTEKPELSSYPWSSCKVWELFTSRRPCKYVEVPRIEYEFSLILMSHVNFLDNKLDEIITTGKTIIPDIVVITEPWQVASELCNVDGYSVFSHLRQRQRGAIMVSWDSNSSLLSVDVQAWWSLWGSKHTLSITPVRSRQSYLRSLPPPSLTRWSNPDRAHHHHSRPLPCELTKS